MKSPLVHLAFAAVLLGATLGACDPVHAALEDAQNDTSGEPNGPLHHPGQVCTACHDGAFGNPKEFSVAGTIFQNENDRLPAVNASVLLTSADGTTFRATTNQAGNFYVEPDRFSPSYPMQAEVTYGGVTVAMSTNIGRDGGCAGCHSDPAGPGSPGHIFVPTDGVTP